jgi:hypothetical protein
MNSLQSRLAFTHTFTQLSSHALELKGPAGPTFFCRAHKLLKVLINNICIVPQGLKIQAFFLSKKKRKKLDLLVPYFSSFNKFKNVSQIFVFFLP